MQGKSLGAIRTSDVPRPGYLKPNTSLCLHAAISKHFLYTTPLPSLIDPQASPTYFDDMATIPSKSQHTRDSLVAPPFLTLVSYRQAPRQEVQCRP